ncbi:MAG: MGMT family protein [Endomicrobia bacterium]|nr:MGMT family protein [Endomicrobiia bacterium]MCX7940293.1 MGMT family protein [Endomicrobiia bacterium]MDW8055803.1 MGMT family protein [Elusimicrobiota bacterium]
MDKIDKKLRELLGRDNFDKIKNYPKFYKKVWLAVLSIPKGEVRTYKWVAKKIGCSNAYRAVGKALKNNPLTVVIPCHRVVKSSGELGGYSKGLNRKLELLKKEGVIFYMRP